MKITAIVLALALLFLVNVIAHSAFLSGHTCWAWGAIAIAFFFSLALGRAFDFLNFTSLHASYAARITRTFLGATNEARTRGGDSAASDISITHPGDDLPHHLYRPEQHGGPLHLISVCVNETVDHASQRHDPSRKGLLMTIGSFGVSVGRRYFAKWSPRIEMPCWMRLRRWLEGLDGNELSPPSLEAIRLDADPNTFHPLARRDNNPAVVQGMSLGEWVAVSGAAFSTGRGRATNMLEALFMGLVNLRLGFWWDSGVRATERPGRFPANVWRRIKELPREIVRAQQVLLSEWRARFDGPSRELWNLSDGGHLDNSSVYELVRRRVPFIICTDATGDAKYIYDELGTMVENVRVDFGAEVEWVDPAQFILPGWITRWINRAHIGTLDQIKGNGEPRGTKHAALARINYPGDDAQESWLLLIKASLTGDESLDVTRYAKTHPDFPQDSTGDQIYDEDQWESYRKLGYKAASAVIQ